MSALARLPWRNAIIPVLGIGLMVFLVWQASPADIGHALAGLKLSYLPILIPLIAFSIVLQALKWHLLVRAQGIDASFLRLLRIHFSCLVYPIITPGRMGILLRIFYLRDYTKRSWEECSTSSVMDGLTEVTVALVMGVVASFFLLGRYSLGILATSSLLLGLMLLGLFLGLRMREGLVKLAEWLPVPRVVKTGLVPLAASFRYVPPARSFVLPALLNGLSWLTIFTQTFVVAVALSIDISFGSLIAVMAVVTVVVSLPASIGGIGTREGTMIVLFSAYGVKAGEVIALALVSRVLGSYIPALAGVVLGLRGMPLVLPGRRVRPVGP